MSQPFSLKDKCVLITGGASGIGLGVCERFLREGANVFVVDLKTPPQAVLDAGAVFHAADVSNRDHVLDAFRAAEDSIGKLHVLIHNAGKPGRNDHLTDSDEAILDGVVALNFYGTYYMLKYGPRYMHDGGSIITTASVAGLQQNEGFFDYSATKAALINLAENLFLDLRPHGVGVTLVNPGFVDTPLTAQNQFSMPALLTPEQAALAIVRGWERGQFELHFPKRFTGVLKLMRCLPYRWYFPLVHRFTGL